MTLNARLAPTDQTPAPIAQATDVHPLVVSGRAPIDPAEARQLLSDDLYMARVWSLIRREEATHTSHLVHSAHPVPAAFTDHPAHSPQTAPAPTGVPGWVWQYSALTLSSGGFIALAGYGIGAAAPGLAALDDILAALGQAVMSIAVLAVLAALLLTGRRTRTGPAGTTVNIRKAVFKRGHFHG